MSLFSRSVTLFVLYKHIRLYCFLESTYVMSYSICLSLTIQYAQYSLDPYTLLQLLVFSLMAEKIVFIHVCVCLCACVCIHILRQSYVDGHLRCFHVLATMNSATMNIKVHVSF